jgi:hypothetical protein
MCIIRNRVPSVVGIASPVFSESRLLSIPTPKNNKLTTIKQNPIQVQILMEVPRSSTIGNQWTSEAGIRRSIVLETIPFELVRSLKMKALNRYFVYCNSTSITYSENMGDHFSHLDESYHPPSAGTCGMLRGLRGFVRRLSKTRRRYRVRISLARLCFCTGT